MKRLLAIVTMTLPIIGVASAGPISLQVSPDSVLVQPGDVVTVGVGILGLDRPPSVGSFDLTMAFDPLLVTPFSIAFGPFLGIEGLAEAGTTFAFNSADVEFSEVSFLLPSELDARQPQDFLLAGITFEAIDNGRAAFALTSGLIDDAFGSKLIEIVPVPDAATGPVGLAVI